MMKRTSRCATRSSDKEYGRSRNRKRRPRQVAIEREEQGGVTLLRTSHDGYAHIFNVVHERVLMLSGDGRRLDGEDSFAPARGELVPADRDQFAIRFHLHPTVKANRLSDGHGAMLAMPNKEAWTFSVYGDRVEVEESVYLAGPDGPRRTVQLVAGCFVQGKQDSFQALRIR